MKRILIAGALAIAAATQAFAADLPPPMAPPPRAPAAYVPVCAGLELEPVLYRSERRLWLRQSTWSTCRSLRAATSSNGGLQLGVTVGGNYQIGQLVLGRRRRLRLAGPPRQQQHGTAALHRHAFASVPACDTASNWIATVPRPRRLRFRPSSWSMAPPAAPGLTSNPPRGRCLGQHSELGWTAGAGIEGAITDNLTAKVEYLYADFGNATCLGFRTAAFADATVSLNESMVRVGLNYKFDGF